MQTATQEVTINDVTMTVEYCYTEYRAATYFDPPELPEIEIQSIMLEDVEVSNILAAWVIDKIIEQIEVPDETDKAADLADYLYEQQREQRMFRD